jgi:type I restriction enzyme S subunit
MTDINKVITDNIDVWTSAIKKRNSQGRGNNKKIELSGVKKLRELILELAVRGKLVPQDANDEPASLLIERIAEEKARLIADKNVTSKRQKQKPLPVITDEEKPFQLSKGWEWTQLGVICEIGPRNQLADDLDVGFVPMPLISTSYKGNHDLEIRKWSEIKKGYTHFADGDIGLAKITPCFENSKAAVFSHLTNGYGAGTTELHIARPIKNTIDPLFILLFLKAPTFLEVGKSKMTGSAGQKRVPSDYFSGRELPLAPLAEQHRIVAKVDELMALCDQLEQQTEQSLAAHQTLVEVLLKSLIKDVSGKTTTDGGNVENAGAIFDRIAQHFDVLFTTEHSIEQLKQTILQLAVMGKLVPQNSSDEPASVLLEKISEEKAQLIADKKIKKQKTLPAITDEEKPLDLPSNWGYERIGTFGIVGTGSTPSRSNPDYWHPAEFNWVSSGETSEFFLNATKEKVSALAIKETNVSLYPAGTLIVAMYGQGKTRGQITELLSEAGTNQACAAIRLVNETKQHKDYVKLYFRKAYAELRSHAAGGAQPNLNVGKIANTVLALPPLAEQHRIVAKVDELMALCDQLKARLSDAQSTQLHLADAVVENALAKAT